MAIILMTQWGWSESLNISSFNYGANHLRDPFTSPAAASLRGMYSTQAKTYKQADVEQQFDPTNLVLKAILTDKKNIAALAIVSKPNNPQENYLIMGSRVEHLLSGLTIQHYKAEIKKDQVVLNKISGGSTVILKLESTKKP